MFDAVIEPYYDDWVMKQKSHVIVKSTDNGDSLQVLINMLSEFLCHLVSLLFCMGFYVVPFFM